MSTDVQQDPSVERTVEARLDSIGAALRGVRENIAMLEFLTHTFGSMTGVTLPSGVGLALRSMLDDLNDFRPLRSAADPEHVKQREH